MGNRRSPVSDTHANSPYFEMLHSITLSSVGLIVYMGAKRGRGLAALSPPNTADSRHKPFLSEAQDSGRVLNF